MSCGRATDNTNVSIHDRGVHAPERPFDPVRPIRESHARQPRLQPSLVPNVTVGEKPIQQTRFVQQARDGIVPTGTKHGDGDFSHNQIP